MTKYPQKDQVYKMKIWFKSLTRTTVLDTDTVIDKIFVELDKPAYRISRRSLNYVEFRENMLRADWNFNQFKYINGGTFRINPETKTVILNYYLDLIYDVIINSVIVLLGIFKDGSFFYFIIATGISITTRLMSQKEVAKGIIDRVVNS